MKESNTNRLILLGLVGFLVVAAGVGLFLLYRDYQRDTYYAQNALAIKAKLTTFCEQSRPELSVSTCQAYANQVLTSKPDYVRLDMCLVFDPAKEYPQLGECLAHANIAVPDNIAAP